MDVIEEPGVNALSLAFHTSAVSHLQDGVYFVDPSRRILYWNRAAEELSGYPSSLVVGRRCYDGLLRHVNDRGVELCHSACPLAKTIADGETREAEVFLFHKDGHRRPVHVRTIAVRDPLGSVVGAVEVFSDSSASLAIKAKVEELGRLALVDPLTGVGNQRYLEMSLRARVDEANRYDGRLGVLCIAVDGLERVNDDYGRPVGDDVLKVVAKTINENSRIFDVVGRWGSDEFMLVAPSVSLRMLEALAERLCTLVSRSAVPLAGVDVPVTVSIGGVVTEGKTPANAIVDMAHRTMETAKSGGRNCVVLAPAP